MTRIIPIILLVICISCQEKKPASGSEISENNTETTIDTTYCRGFRKSSAPKEVNTSMYNDPYSISIFIKPLKKLRVLSSEGTTVTVCNEREGTLILKKKNDTIFTKKINNSLFSAEENFDRFQALRLDSIAHQGARTNTIYFTCYFSEDTTNRVFESGIGIDYLKDIGNTFVFTPLKEIE